jgi:hypothetical protein
MAQRTDLQSLEISVSRTLRFVTAAMVAFLAAYFYWFFIAHGQQLSSDTSAWGQFGDFIGGILNPLVAYSAFYWLTRSVLLQKEELLETRRALEASAAAQVKHASAAEKSLKVAAYTALLNSSVTEVQTLRTQVDSLLERALKTPTGAARLPSGEWAQSDKVHSYVAELSNQIAYHSTQRIKHEEALRALLNAPDGAA